MKYRDFGKLFFVAFHFHQCAVRARALAQAGSSLVGRQYVRISVLVERPDSSGLLRVVPGARGELDHAGEEPLGDDGSREDGSALVENS